MKYGLVFLLFLIPYLLVAQLKPTVVEGNVTDVSHKPIAYAIVQAVGTPDGCVADAGGYYKFTTTLPATLKASLMGYKTQFQHIKTRKGDTVKIDFVLGIDSAELQQVNVAATHESQLLKESGSLLDFEVKQNTIWLLYNYRKGEHLEVYDTGMHYLAHIVLRHRTGNLNKTPHNILYIENNDSVGLLYYSPLSKRIEEYPVANYKFHVFLNHLIAYKPPNYYYQWNSTDSSAIVYWYYNNLLKKHVVLYSYGNSGLSLENDTLLNNINYFTNLYVYDDEGMSMAMSETGETGESEYAPDMKNLTLADRPKDSRYGEDRIQLLKALFHGIYCPLRIVRDSTYIFNFDDDSIYVYSLQNTRIRQMPLSFTKYSAQDIIVNDEGTECYFTFTRNGMAYLQKIDLDNGTVLNTGKLQFAFPEKIRIMGGYAYYTYSELGDNGMFIRHFYKQQL